MSSLSEGRKPLFLQRYFDPELKPRAASREELETAEVERISRALSVVLLAGSIPRRLGGDASSEDLALDKKRAKRSAHALNQAMRGWVKKAFSLDTPSQEIRKEAAQIDWVQWREAHIIEVHNRLLLIATWGILNNEERWAKSAVVRLENELSWIGYALRD